MGNNVIVVVIVISAIVNPHTDIHAVLVWVVFATVTVIININCRASLIIITAIAMLIKMC